MCARHGVQIAVLVDTRTIVNYRLVDSVCVMQSQSIEPNLIRPCFFPSSPVPPKIEDSLSSGDKVKTEGSNVTLECAARGSPTPRVLWKREDGQNINIDKSRNFSGEKETFSP